MGSTGNSLDADIPMVSAEKPRLLVHITNGAEITPYYFEVCVLTDVIDCHLEHPQMQISHWAEGTTCDEDEGLLVRIPQRPGESMNGKPIVERVGENGLHLWVEIAAHGSQE